MPVSRSIDRKSTRLHSSHTEIYTFPYTTLFRSMLRDPRVYEDQRIPFSRNLIVDPRAVDLVHACLPKHLFPFPDTLTSPPAPGSYSASMGHSYEDARLPARGQYTLPASAAQEGQPRA